MKYRKWWMPAVFMSISAAVLAAAYFLVPMLFEDDSPEGFLSFAIGYGVWFLLLIPALSMIYTRKVIVQNKERFLLSLFNSTLIVLPILMWLFAGVDKDRLFWIIMTFIWAEMWALLGLSRKGEKKSDVWYVPIFIAVAALVVNIWIRVFISKTLIIAILSCIVCPIAIAIYTRTCVRDRKNRIFYTVYVTLLVFASIFGYTVYSISDGSISLGDSIGGTVKLILSAVGVLVLYELAALIGAGVKIKFPKRKQKEEAIPDEEEKGNSDEDEKEKE